MISYQEQRWSVKDNKASIVQSKFQLKLNYGKYLEIGIIQFTNDKRNMSNRIYGRRWMADDVHMVSTRGRHLYQCSPDFYSLGHSGTCLAKSPQYRV